MGDKHGWNSWNEYLNAHEGCVRHYSSYFIVSDEVVFEKTDRAIFAEGKLLCIDGIEIVVTKTLEVHNENGWVKVRTVEYAYHVMQRLGGEVTNLFRYDNIHLHSGHSDRHHKHTYQPDKTDVTSHVGHEGWPTLLEVIAEAYHWWQNNVATNQLTATPPPSQ